MRKIDLVYCNAGGGHRSAALALDEVIRRQRRPWEVELVNLFEVLDPSDAFYRATGMKPEHYYNARLTRGWTLGLAQELRILQGLIRLSHQSLVARLAAHWCRTRPDMVISLVPNFNRAMHTALAQARPEAPYVTIMTDLADFPPHFWIEPGQPQHLICGTRRAVEQAKRCRIRRRAHSRDHRNDHPARILRHFAIRSASRNARARPRPGFADRRRDVRRPWFKGNAADRKATE